MKVESADVDFYDIVTKGWSFGWLDHEFLLANRHHHHHSWWERGARGARVRRITGGRPGAVRT